MPVGVVLPSLFGLGVLVERGARGCGFESFGYCDVDCQHRIVYFFDAFAIDPCRDPYEGFVYARVGDFFLKGEREFLAVDAFIISYTFSARHCGF